MDIVLIGLLGGLITGISPCILPVLPVIFLTGGAQSARTSADGSTPQVSRWRPYLVILGLMTSFTLVTLIGSLILGALGLPPEIFRWVGIAVLVIIGVGLLFPQVQHLLEKPFQRLTPKKEVSNQKNGLLVGLALGLVFVPCAGPVLAAIIVAGSTGQIGVGTVALTVSFAVGVAIPLLFFALAGRGLVERIKAFRSRERGLRITGGIAMLALAVGLVFNLPQALQQLIPDYTAPLQSELSENESVNEALNLGGLVNDENKDLDKCTNGASELESCGTAPSIKGIEQWLNTPNGEPIAIDDLKGKVVLIDFWAYSCINCQRSIPHVVAWNEAYKDAGLEIIGVHSPEYAFEKSADNVKSGAKNFGITYPVALDNNLSTWTNYRNRYWPAHYLVDADGTVRHISFGEGNYAETESMIRELLIAANPDVTLPPATDVADTTPEIGSTTPETFLGSSKDKNYAGVEPYRAGEGTFTLPADQQADTFALEGDFRIETQYATPAGDKPAKVQLTFTAATVQMVLGGSGTVQVSVDGKPAKTLEISGTPNAYTLFEGASETGVIEVTMSPGVEGYSFTFG